MVKRGRSLLTLIFEKRRIAKSEDFPASKHGDGASLFHALVVIFLEYFAWGLLTVPVININASLQGLLSFLSAPLVGALSDAYGRKRFLLLTVFCTCMPIPCLKISPWWYFTLFTLSGFFAVTFSVVLAYVADITEKHDRPTACGLVSATFAASLVSSPALGAWLSKRYSDEVVVLLATVVVVLDLLFVIFYVSESLPQKARNVNDSMSWQAADPLQTLRLAFEDKTVLKLALVVFLSYLPEAGQFSCFFVYLKLVVGFSPEAVAAYIALVGILSVVSQTGILLLITKHCGPKHTITIGLTFQLMQLIWYGLGTKDWMMWTAGVLAAMSQLSYPSISAFVSLQTDKDLQGTVQGVLTGIRGLCQGFGPAIFGIIFYMFDMDLTQDSDGTGHIGVGPQFPVPNIRVQPFDHVIVPPRNETTNDKPVFDISIIPGPPFLLGALMVFLGLLVNMSLPTGLGGKKLLSRRLSAIAVRLDENWDDVLTKGPPADSQEAKDFRKFYGELSQIRKFPDGSLCEAVLWTENKNKDASVLKKIAENITSKHIGKAVVKLRTFNIKPFVSAKEEYSTVCNSFEHLSSTLHGLKGLPLGISSVLCTSEFYRRTRPYPPFGRYMFTRSKRSKVLGDKVARIALGLEDNEEESGPTPFFTPVLKIMMTMEHSSKFGDTHQVMNQFKTAFYIEIGERLKEKGFFTISTEKGIYVDVNNIPFFIEIGLPKEMIVARKLSQNNQSSLIMDGFDFISLAKKIQDVPLLSSQIYGLSRRFSAFGECCQLLKRFVASHYLSSNVDEFILELLVAEAFLRIDSEKGSPPMDPFAGFVHVLNVLSTHDFVASPLFVDFGDKLDGEKKATLMKKFDSARLVLPSLVIYTSDDDSGIIFTKNLETVIFSRLIQISKAALLIISKHMDLSLNASMNTIFGGELTEMDVTIKIDYEAICSREKDYIEAKKKSKELKDADKNKELPIMDFNPVEKYLNDLKKSFFSIALFFYNPYGGTQIGVAFRPKFKEIIDFKVNQCLCRKWTEKGLEPNYEEFLETVQLLGKVDELAGMIAVEGSLNDGTVFDEHPRFSGYKNLGKIQNKQRERRNEFLENQKSRRLDAFDKYRTLVDDEVEDEEEEVMETEEGSNAFRQYSSRVMKLNKKYKDQLMFSEWLIDIPDELQESWNMVTCPVGKRVLVVAKEGTTRIFNKVGLLLGEIKSGLSGGGPGSKHGMTILDCIRLKDNKRFYVLDVLYASGMYFNEVEASIRFSMLPSIVEEADINRKQMKKNSNVPVFLIPQNCRCLKEEMTRLMNMDIDFELDGLLFYNDKGWYIPGYTPLVGWLKPWMMAEVLGIEIADRYKQDRPSVVSLNEYISEYNVQHNHRFVNGKPWEKPVEDDSVIEIE
ncbi:hypothetical protein FO519_007299 [Halicephalobus sp. NKZ332]|nr:hypothetical protein FO519_007299 [Halicephalobus sp. NKZ332]